MSQAHKDAALKRAAKYPPGYFSTIARNRHKALSKEEKKQLSITMLKGKRAKMKANG